MNKHFHFDIFCKIIDNFGDIGVSYRLSKELAESHNCNIRLFVSNLDIFKKIEINIDVSKTHQKLNEKIEVVSWDDSFCSIEYISSLSPNEVILEMFGCSIPEYYSNKITFNNVWINIEYLSAENWVEDCHMKQSFEKGIIKYFFFPGFTNRTGGLNFEKNIENKTPNIKNNIISDYNLNNKTLLVSVFCYENKNILGMISNIDLENIAFLIPNGIFSNFLKKYSDEYQLTQISENIFKNRFNSTLIIIPLSNQESYDSLLNSCDFNIVRGEDSFVRTQILSKPFIWNIYEQEQNIHIQKLNSFLEKYLSSFSLTTSIDKEIKENLTDLSNKINNSFNENNINNYTKLSKSFCFLLKNIEKINVLSKNWQKKLIQNKTLSHNLIKFAESLKK